MADKRSAAVIPPPPPGFTVDAVPPPPPGFSLDGADPRPLEERPATLNPSLQAQGAKYRKNMEPPTSVMDPRQPAYAQAQRDADALSVVGGLAGAVAGGVLAPGAGLMRSAGKNLMQRAMKPTAADLLAGKADRAAQTMLDRGINVTRRGMDKLRSQGTALNQNVQGILDNSTATIPKGAPATRLQDEIASIERSNPLPNSPRGGVEGVYNEYMTNPNIAPNISLADAQRYKQSLYQGLKKEYGKLSTGDEAGRKALARGLKEEIETRAPQVAGLNAAASDVWNALNVAERRALISQNNNLLGLMPLAHSPEYQTLFLLDRSPTIQSLVARGLYNSQRVPGVLMGGTLGGNMTETEMLTNGLVGSRESPWSLYPRK